MEVPRYWRESPSRIKLETTADYLMIVDPKNIDNIQYQGTLRYLGGQIPLDGSFEEIYDRLEDKGFKPDVIEKILFDLFGTVASETPITLEKIIDSQSELVRREVRKESGGKVKLRINRLPREITRKAPFSASTNN